MREEFIKGEEDGGGGSRDFFNCFLIFLGLKKNLDGEFLSFLFRESGKGRLFFIFCLVFRYSE